MKKKILLIQPRHGVWDGVFIRFPESVLSIAALPHSKGYDVKILDYRILHGWKRHLKTYLESNKPICVGITGLTGPALQYVLDSVRIIKEKYSTMPIIFGGVHATLLPEQSLKVSGIDVIVKGEGDFTFFQLVKVFEKNSISEAKTKGLLKNIPGIYYEKGINYEKGITKNSNLTENKFFDFGVKTLQFKGIQQLKDVENNIVFTGEPRIIADMDSLTETP